MDGKSRPVRSIDTHTVTTRATFALTTIALATIAGCATIKPPLAMETVGAKLANYAARRAPAHPPSPSPGLRPRTFSTPPFTSDPSPFAFARISNTSEPGRNIRTAHSSPAAPATEPRTPTHARTPLPGFWETVERDLNEWPLVFWQDTKDVFTNKQNLMILGLGYGASLAMQETGPDDTVEDSFRTHSTFKKDARDTLGVLGNPGTHFGLAGLWYLVGQQSQNERTYDVGNKLFRALAVNGVTTLFGQAATWEKSPNGEWGTFPSGHTSSSFAFASVLHHEYGPWVGAPLYALSAAVGYSRLEDQEHYLSDVVMGGILGLVVGHTIANDGEPPQLFGGSITPYADPRTASTGIAWVKSFR